MNVAVFRNDFQLPPDQLFDLATDWSHIQASVEKYVRYRDLPPPPHTSGQKINAGFQLFGLGPRIPWTLEVTEFDREARVRVYVHQGFLLRGWRHTTRVIDRGDHSELIDMIEVFAGRLTGLYLRWAMFSYNRCHARLWALAGAGN